MQDAIVLLIVFIALLFVIKYYKPKDKKRCTGCDAGCDDRNDKVSVIKFYKKPSDWK